MTYTHNRRAFLKIGAFALGAGALSACGVSATATQPGAQNPVASASASGTSAGFVPDVEIGLKAAQGSAQILPGAPTNVWAYQAQVLKGDPGSVVTLPNNYLGPIIKVKSGQKVRVQFSNELPDVQPTTVHWHGVLVPDKMDGHPKQQINPGQTYVYEFEVKNRPGTYWFHPHPHEQTALQVNNGLAGLFIVADDDTLSQQLPSGEFDIPIIIQDRTFDANNQFVYDALNMTPMMGNGVASGAMRGMMGGAGQSGGMGGMMGGMGGMMGGMAGMNHGQMMSGGGQSGMMAMNMQGMMAGVMGFLGERVVVNGKADYVLPVSTRAYRLRLLNGSNARIYKLAWADGTDFTVIGTDGGLLDRPITRKFLMLAPGERVDVWMDFGQRKVGDELTLESQRFESGETMGGTGSSAPELGAPMRVMEVRVDKKSSESLALPQTLSQVNPLRAEDAINANSPRRFKLTLNGMQWLINGRSFEMDKVAPDEIVKLNTTEVWEFVNALNPGQMMDANGMPHPMHIHGVQFNVVQRTVLPELKPLQDGVRDGIIDEGWKDTVLLMPGETVKVVMRFTEPGRFLYHCHNLEHESQGLMRNFDIRA